MRPKWQRGRDLLDPDHDPECHDLVHDRMPVILDPDGYDLWLDPGMNTVSELSKLLVPFDAKSMRSYPVSTRINYVANDDEECSRPVEVAETQNRLFA